MAHYLDRAECWDEIWEQELVVRYPEWPRALVLSQRALGAWAGEGESCRDQPEQCGADQGDQSKPRPR